MTEDRHQNIVSRVALKKGVEPWTIERVAKFIDLLGYREITLKSDTDAPITAFRNRVAEVYTAEVTTEDAVKGHEESKALIENAVVLIRGIIRTILCHIGSRTHSATNRLSCRGWWNMQHAFCPDVNRVVRKAAWQEADTIICSTWRESVGKTNLHR